MTDLSPSQWRVNTDRVAQYLIVLLAAMAPAFEQDDAALFNYMNNVVAPRALFFTQDYVPVAPELVAYALRGLPLLAQALLYRVLPLAVMLVLYRELRNVLRLGGDRAGAVLIALSVMLILRVVEVSIWANLTSVITTMFLAAALHALRVNREGRRYSPWAMVAMVLAAISVPFGILIVPILLAHVPGDQDAMRQRQHLAMAVIMTIGYLAFTQIGAAMSVADPAGSVGRFFHAFRSEYRWNNAMVLVSSVVLVVAAVMDAVRVQSRSHRLMTTCLAGLGLASTGAVLVSDRMVLGDGGFGGAYVLPVLVAALVVVGRWVLSVDDRARRGLLVGMFVGVSATVAGNHMAPRLRGPMEDALMRYRFLLDGQAFRQHCQDGDGRVFEHEDTSPVILCRPIALGVGRHLQSQFIPDVGGRDPDAAPGEQPVIVVGRPVF